MTKNKRTPACIRSGDGRRFHKLNVCTNSYNEIRNNKTTHRCIRKYDKDFQIGDLLDISEWDPLVGECTGRSMMRVIIQMSMISTEIMPNSCMLDIAPTERST